MTEDADDGRQIMADRIELSGIKANDLFALLEPEALDYGARIAIRCERKVFRSTGSVGLKFESIPLVGHFRSVNSPQVC